MMIFKYGHVIASIAKRYLATRCHSRVIHFVEKQSIAVLSLVSLFACTDYEAQIDEEYEEWIAEQEENFSEPSSSSSKVIKHDEEVSSSGSIAIGFKTDSRNGQTYKTLKIGSQLWMAENLNYKTDGSFCYDDDANNCMMYGRLYTWDAATTACPSSWHLPTETEWKTLITAVGGSSVAGGKLKATSGWYNNGNGTDAFGFSALPAGYRYYGGLFNDEGGYANFWSSTESDSYHAYIMYLINDYDEAYLGDGAKYFGYSVRCLKD